MFFQDTLLVDVKDLLLYWKPKKQYPRESQYRDELMQYLNKNLNRPKPFFFFSTYQKVSIKKEVGGSFCDIAIDGKHIGIELKKDLDSKTKVDRLLGQVDRYLNEYQYVFIVLVGYTTLTAYSDLEEKIAQKQAIYGPRIEIISKAVQKPSKIKSSRTRKKRKTRRR